MHKIINLLIIVAGTLVPASCSLREDIQTGEQEKARATFTLITPDRLQTRSHYILPEEEYGIYNYCICVWDTEHPLEMPTLTAGKDDPASLSLNCGSEYIVAAIINTDNYYNLYHLSLLDRAGGHPILEQKMDMNKLKEVNYAYHNLGMTMVTTNLTRFRMEKDVEIPLYFDRVLARFEICLDTSALKGESVNITSVRIKNSAYSIQPFFEEGEKPHKPVDTFFVDGDYASEDDIREINRGENIVLFVPENLQGTLLPGNTDPAKKNPDSIGKDAAKACTYLEICAVHSRLGDVTYRCYLGEDNCTNFDIVRNTSYKVTIRPSADGLGVSCWKLSY